MNDAFRKVLLTAGQGIAALDDALCANAVAWTKTEAEDCVNFIGSFEGHTVLLAKSKTEEVYGGSLTSTSASQFTFLPAEVAKACFERAMAAMN